MLDFKLWKSAAHARIVYARDSAIAGIRRTIAMLDDGAAQ